MSKTNNYFILFLISILAIVLVHNLNSLWASLLVIYFYSLSIIFANSKNGVSDPRVFLLGFMTIYCTFYSLSYFLIGVDVLSTSFPRLLTSLQYQFSGIVTFVLVSYFIIDNSAKKKFPFIEGFSIKLMFSEKILTYFFILCSFAAVVLIWMSGAISKRDVLNQGNMIYALANFFMIFLVVTVVIKDTKQIKAFYRDPLLLVILCFSLLYMLVTGERDVFFRIAFVLLIIYFEKKNNFNFKYAIGILCLAIFLVPFSQFFKSLLLSGTLDVKRTGIELLLSNEFISSSRNFYSLILYDVDQDVRFLFSDLLRGIFPSVLFPGINLQSTGTWFNKVFRVDNDFSGTSGWGFTLMGTGYIIAGLPGVVIVSAVYSMIISKLYNLRYKSIYWYSFYLLAFTTSVYVLRADLANFISQIFKVGGFAVLIYWFTHLLFKKMK